MLKAIAEPSAPVYPCYRSQATNLSRALPQDNAPTTAKLQFRALTAPAALNISQKSPVISACSRPSDLSNSFMSGFLGRIFAAMPADF